MRFTAAVFTVLMIFVVTGFAQADDDEGLKLLKQDFKTVKVVARVQIEKVEIDEEMGKPQDGRGYTFYRFKGKILESFKGKFTAGDPIEYFSVIEGQPYKSVEDLPSGNHVRFLEIYRNKFGLTSLTELENSARAATDSNLAALRRLRRKR